MTLLDLTELNDAVQQAQWNAGMLARTEALCRSGSFEVILPSGRVVMSEGLQSMVGIDATGSAEAQVDAMAWIPADEQAFVADIWRNATPGEPFEFQHRVQGADGSRLIVLHRGLVSDEADGQRRGVGAAAGHHGPARG